VAVLGIVGSVEHAQTGDRIGIYSYGSGSCAEFYSGIVGRRAKEIARAARLPELQAGRFEVSVEAYERIENERERGRQSACFTPDLASVEGLYDARYRGRDLLTYRGSNDFCRRYEFS
jgi:3-hydroxy-3-methylglutaryl CoA synthase